METKFKNFRGKSKPKYIPSCKLFKDKVEAKAYMECLDNILEKALSKDQTDDIDRIQDAEFVKELLKKNNKIIKELQDECKNITFDKLVVKKVDDTYNVYFSYKIQDLLSSINNSTIKLYDDENYNYIMDKIYQGGYTDSRLEIDITGEFNKIDVMNGLPNFMKGLGLGTKIYKVLIKKKGYIASFHTEETSMDSDFVWTNILHDQDMFSFSNGNNFISFWNEYDTDKITKILKKFYKHHSDNFQLDNDFMNKIGLTEYKLR